MSNLSALHFRDEKAACAFVEARLWPHGPVVLGVVLLTELVS